MFCFLVFGCQYQCSQLSGKTHLQNDLLYVEWDINPLKCSGVSYIYKYSVPSRSNLHF